MTISVAICILSRSESANQLIGLPVSGLSELVIRPVGQKKKKKKVGEYKLLTIFFTVHFIISWYPCFVQQLSFRFSQK